MPLELSASEQTCALGAAIFAAVAAGPDSGGYGTVEEAQQAMTGTREGPYEPRASGRESYDELYSLYSRLHDAFGGVNDTRLADGFGELLGPPSVTGTDVNGDDVEVVEHIVGTITEMDYSSGAPRPTVDGYPMDIGDILRLTVPNNSDNSEETG